MARRRAPYRLSLLLGLSLLIPAPAAAGGGGNGLGMLGTIGGGLLIYHGMSNLSKDYKLCKANAGMNAACGKLAFDVLEIAGGAAAMMANSANEAQTRDDFKMPGTSPSETAPGGGGSGAGGGDFPGFDIDKTCQSNCEVDSKGRPILTIPPVEEMKAVISRSFNGKSVNDEGLSLEDALKKLDNSYDDAAAAVASFNAASAAGKFDSALGETMLAGTGSEGDDESTGLNRGTAALAGGANANEAVILPNGTATSWDSLLGKTKTERGSPKGARAVGLNLEDAKSGQPLNIWERLSRSLRGTRDRDLILAKMEWTRKQAFKKHGKEPRKPNVAVSTEKL